MAEEQTPFAPSLATADASRPLSSTRSAACTGIWCLGTFMLTALVVTAAISDNFIPGGILYVVLILSPVITLVSSAAAPISFGYRVLAFFASLALMLAQLVMFGLLGIYLHGFNEIGDRTMLRDDKFCENNCSIL